jgi:hypothetical protein
MNNRHKNPVRQLTDPKNSHQSAIDNGKVRIVFKKYNKKCENSESRIAVTNLFR